MKHLKDYNLEPPAEKVQCIGCNNYFDDDDIMCIFNENLCDNCIDYMLKNNVDYFRDLIQKMNKIDKQDIDYLFERLDKINKERN